MINAGETVRVAARPFGWDGILDAGALVTYTSTFDGDTSVAQPLPWFPGVNAYVGVYVPKGPGTHRVRIKAVLSDGTVSVETRVFEVKT